MDREIFPLRRTDRPGVKPSRHWLDLLLVADDGLPIIGELKIRQDKPTYFAFVQSLAYAVELSSAAQLDRLRRHYQDHGLRLPADGPFLDIYLIAFEPPARGKYRQRSFEATEAISKRMMADGRCMLDRQADRVCGSEGGEQPARVREALRLRRLSITALSLKREPPPEGGGSRCA